MNPTRSFNARSRADRALPRRAHAVAPDAPTSTRTFNAKATPPLGALKPAAFAARLRQAREAAGLSQRQASDQMDVHATALSRAENGKNFMRADTLREFCRVCGCSADWLLGLPAAAPPAERDGLLP